MTTAIPSPKKSPIFELVIKNFESLPSTSTLAQQYAADGAAEGLVITASYQSAGRGKPGRKWESPAGKNLLFSLLIRPPISPSKAPMITQIACRAVASVLKKNYGLHPEFKRPNDLLVNGKKICGVLTESTSCEAKIESVVIGIGLNVNAAGEELPSHATSIFAMTKKPADLKVVLNSILTEIQNGLLPFYAHSS